MLVDETGQFFRVGLGASQNTAQVFELELGFGFVLLPMTVAGGALVSTAIGWLAVRRLVRTPPLLALRNAA